MTRELWVDAMSKLVEPVLEAINTNRLKATLPTDLNPDKAAFAPLEAFARTLAGIAPWLELDAKSPSERELQLRYREYALAGLDHATNPDAADYMNWGDGGDQPLVDAGFLAQALLRAPTELLQPLSGRVRGQLIACFKQTRRIWHPDNNWLFFSGMVEAALFALGEEIVEERIHFIIDRFEGWYLGDGVYGDGKELHVDYYNSLVIHPMYLDMCRTLAPVVPRCEAILPEVLRRARRHAVILEHLIAPDGTYPAIGRSLTYRSGVFHLLAQMALLHELDESLAYGQVRAALTAVLRRSLIPDANYDEASWLLPGVAGHQANLAERYINRGSLYLASAILLPLGLDEADSFWTDPEAAWTMKRLWEGEEVSIDHAL